MGFQGIGTVFEVVGGGDDLSRELIGFAGQDEALFGAVGQGCTEYEAAGFGREDAVVGESFGGLGEGVDGRMQGVAVPPRLRGTRGRSGAKALPRRRGRT